MIARKSFSEVLACQLPLASTRWVCIKPPQPSFSSISTVRNSQGQGRESNLGLLGAFFVLQLEVDLLKVAQSSFSQELTTLGLGEVEAYLVEDEGDRGEDEEGAEDDPLHDGPVEVKERRFGSG